MSPTAPPPSYAAVLRIRHARRTFAAALLGRLSYAVVGLSLLLSVRDAADSYALAGGVTAAFGLTSVVFSLTRAGLVDRYGPRRALPPMAAGYAVLLTGLALATATPGAPGALLVGLAAAAGACAPPLGAVMRTLWSQLAPDRLLLQRAYSLDGVAEELLLVTGPLLVGLMVGVAAPPVGVAVSGGLALTGAVALAWSPATLTWGRAETEAAGATGATSGRMGERSGLRQAVVISLGVGMSLGAVELLVIAFADEHHASAAVPWVLAVMSAGSAVGGLAYGAVGWRASGRVRLAVLALALGLVLAATGLSPHPLVLAVGAALTGLFVAPAITTAYLVADECAGPGARTRAGARVNAALNAGSSGAMAGVGLLVGRVPLSVCFALAGAPAAVAGLTAVTRPGRGARAGAEVPAPAPVEGEAGEQRSATGG